MKRSADAAFVVEQLPGTPGPSYSPAPDTPTPSTPSDCPPRKRSRSEITPEERKEARAHRNRIAAQNSRDRRKAQFAYLERRVAELEEENRQLRAGMGIASHSPSEEQLSQERQKELAREKENQELRKRIKTLENGWDAVIKALAASGLPLAVPPPPPHHAESSTASSRPVFAQPTHSYPSPAPSSPSSSSGFEFDEYEPTRHLAAGGLATNQLELELTPSPSTQAATATPTVPIDEGAMEDLFREILAPSPLLSSAPVPIGITIEDAPQPPSTGAPVVSASPAPPMIDWEGEAEMQRLLEMLPDVATDVNGDAPSDAIDFPSALDLGLNGWELPLTSPAPSSAVAAF